MGYQVGKKIRALRKGQLAFWCVACRCAHFVYLDEYEHKTSPQWPTWTFNGDGDKPTFNPSVNVNSNHAPARCHSWVRDGMITYCSDSWHGLSGQTIPLPDWPVDGDDDMD